MDNIIYIYMDIYFLLSIILYNLFSKSLEVISSIDTIIAAFIALVGVMLTVRYNHKLKKTEITATVISKSRIEWIQDVRKLMSDYISQSYVLKEIVNSRFNEYFMSNKTKQKYYHEYYKLLKYRDLLLLYISDSEEHKEIVKLIECLHEKTMFNLNERNLSKEKRENYHRNQRQAAEKLRVRARNYFKDLWEEAKIETELNKNFSNK